MKRILKYFIRKILKIVKVNKIILGKNKGFKFRYAEDLNLDMMFGFHEPNTFEVFNLFVKEGMIVADIGANIGYFTKYLSNKVGPDGLLFSFEPIPYTYKRLVETISLNELNNVIPIESAVCNVNGRIKIYLSHTHYMASLDSQWAGEIDGEIEVNGITLDMYFEERRIYPDFIKMDIEGGGVYALEGMKECILKNEPILFLESHTSAEDLAIGKALSLIPYKVFRVGNKEHIKYLDRDYRDKFGIYGTVIAIPKTKLNLFGDWHPSVFQKDRHGQRY